MSSEVGCENCIDRDWKMNGKHGWTLLLAGLAIAAGAAAALGISGRRAPGGDAAHEVAMKVAPSPGALMHSSSADLKGQQQTLSQWKGKVLVVNFWATWCPPCRAEIPAFIDDQEKYGAQGLQFVGIAVDHTEDVQKFAKEYGINYPVLQGENGGMELAASLGNSAFVLPYSVVIDRTGKVAGVATGMMDDNRFNALVRPLL